MATMPATTWIQLKDGIFERDVWLKITPWSKYMSNNRPQKVGSYRAKNKPIHDNCATLPSTFTPGVRL